MPRPTPEPEDATGDTGDTGDTGRHPEPIARAVERLRAGGIVAFPTETVYGLGADALADAPVRRVFELKGRPATNPLIVHVADAAMARRACAAWPSRAQRLAARFWPGPLTLVLDRAPGIPDVVTGGGETVGVRCPDHPLALELIRRFDRPIVGPSANHSGSLSPTTPAHVRAAFAEADVLVLDGGPCRTGIESTVIDLTGAVPRVLRPGVIGRAALEPALGERIEDASAPSRAGAGPARAPGMLGPHYRPRAPLRVCASDRIAEDARAQAGVAVLARSDAACEAAHVIRMPDDAAAYAARLYAALREADEAGATLILVERPPAGGSTPEETATWQAIGERLARAAGGRGTG